MQTAAANCDISDPELRCTASGGGTTSTVYIYYDGTDVMTVTYFELSLYAVTSGSLGTPGDYTLEIQLPQYYSSWSARTIFGPNYNVVAYFCSCTSNFKIANTAIGTAMNLNTPTMLSNMKNTMTSYSFSFGSYSYRDTFFSTSYFQFNWGFLTLPSSTYRNSRNNFRCRIYELDDAGSPTLSAKWSHIDFSNFASVRLYPKAEFEDPASYLFQFSCFGAAAPTTNTTDMSLVWQDTSGTMQTATSMPDSSLTLLPDSTASLTASIQAKRFTNQGMKAFYTFQITSAVAMDEVTRI